MYHCKNIYIVHTKLELNRVNSVLIFSNHKEIFHMLRSYLVMKGGLKSHEILCDNKVSPHIHN